MWTTDSSAHGSRSAAVDAKIYRPHRMAWSGFLSVLRYAVHVPVTVCPSVCLCVCATYVGVLSVRLKQGAALTGRNRTGPPCSVDRLTARGPGPAAVDPPRARQPARRPPAALQTTTDDRRLRAKQYWLIRRTSNNYDHATNARQ